MRIQVLVDVQLNGWYVLTLRRNDVVSLIPRPSGWCRRFGLGFRRIAASQLNVKFIVIIAKGEASKSCLMSRTEVRGAGRCSLEDNRRE
jgi:hypothetical protein